MVDDKLLAKLVVQFPTVEEGHIFSLLKQYNNRENVVVGALLAEVIITLKNHIGINDTR